jgi:hypothetical protein
MEEEAMVCFCHWTKLANNSNIFFSDLIKKYHWHDFKISNLYQTTCFDTMKENKTYKKKILLRKNK